MGANKKKKKPSNPARGFATVSVPSKAKPDVLSDSVDAAGPYSDGSEKPRQDDASQVPSSESQPQPTSELLKLSPEELEKHLEESELQLIVEKHGLRCKSDASRSALKLVAEKRLLRSQAASLNLTSEWALPGFLEKIIEKERIEIMKSPTQVKNPDIVGRITSNEDEICVNIWTVRLTLLELGYRENDVDKLINDFLLYGSLEKILGKDHGSVLEQALQFFAFQIYEDEMASYEKELVSNLDASGTTSENELESNQIMPEKNLDAKPPETTTASSERIPSRHPSSSDSESDDMLSDPESLVPQYVALMTRLYELDPTIFRPGKNKKGSQQITAGKKDPQIDSKIARVKSKLARLEQDILLDRDEADAIWAETLTHLRQGEVPWAKQKPVDSDAPLPVVPTVSITEAQPKDPITESSDDVLETQEDAAMFGELFIEPGSIVEDNTSASGSTNTVTTLRDFGKFVGINPGKVLEELCRTRDPNFKLLFRDLSPSSYSNRKAVEIKWSKAQNISFDVPLPEVSYTITPFAIAVSMVATAAVTASQAEGYVSTIAIFMILCHGWKETKIPMRLTGIWKMVWEEIAQQKKDYDDQADRGTVQGIRSHLQNVINHMDEDVVFTHNFRQRNVNREAIETIDDKSSAQNISNSSTELQRLWETRRLSASFQNMLKSRMELPMWSFRQEILETLSQNQVIIICGETGCGKSTQLPSFILENELASGRPCKVYIAEPRRISAISLARRVSEELGENKMDIGTNRSLVGYAIRLESKVTASTRLIFATTGVVIRMLEQPQNFADVTHLILDEVHERTIDGDFLLIILRRLLQVRVDLKLILMSATVDAQKFANYFGKTPVLNVPGRMFPVETKYLEDVIELTKHRPDDSQSLTDDTDTTSDEDSDKPAISSLQSSLNKYSKQTQATVLSLNEYRLDYKMITQLVTAIATRPELHVYSKAILIFMPGFAEIRRLQDEILSESLFQTGWVIHLLHSSIASEEQEKAFLIPPKGMRKIVISTNIAETGVTIPDITAVVDPGKEKVMRFDERRQISKLVEVFVSRANAKQRRGRAGRVQKGICFHLFSKYRHDKLLFEQQVPEMLRLSLQDLLLRVKICNLGDIESTLSEALDPPSAKNIRRAIESLKTVKALTSSEALTPLGKQLAKLPLDVSLGKLCLYGAFFKCVDATVSIAAILSCKSPFLNDSGRKSQIEASRKAFERGNSDLLTVYNAYSSWKKHRAESNEFSFCRKNHLSPQALLNIEDVKTQLMVSLVDTGLIKLSDSEEKALSRARYTGRKRSFFTVPDRLDFTSKNNAVVNAVIAWSFYPRLLTRHGKGWKNVYNNQSVVLHTASVNKHSETPLKWLSYYHIMQSRNRNYNAHETSMVEDLAIALCCGDVEFKMYAGVISIDNGRIKFKVKDWKSMIALKVLSNKVRDAIAQTFKSPKKEMSLDQKEWLGFCLQILSIGKGSKEFEYVSI
ncbi:hypothetical protein FQN57_002791 [Myotisia sp. PD_48]|nr:hypothetical protein FQN57_002791 [Myotisia sp. PD_48]